jgi:hypothetical protein
MAHFAQLDEQNIVLNVVVVSNDDIDHLPFPESEPVGIAYLQETFGADTIWKQTSYNSNFRRQYAQIGGSYYPPLDVFVGAAPYPSWVFQASDATWQPPIPMPQVPPNYFAVWNENIQSWSLVLSPEASI